MEISLTDKQRKKEHSHSMPEAVCRKLNIPEVGRINDKEVPAVRK